MNDKPLLAVYQNAEQLRERLIAEIETTDDIETLIDYAKAIFQTMGVEQDKIGRIVVRYDPSPERKKLMDELDLEDE